MTFRSRLHAIHKNNVRTLRSSPLAELSGALGDLGTLLPLMIAMTLNGSIDIGSTLVFSGLANILTGVVFGVPLPVQPMKAIAAVAISQRFSKQETAAAGITTGAAVFLLSATGLLRWLNRVVPVPVVKGIQVGAGLSLVISAGTAMLQSLAWTRPGWDNRIWAIAAFLLLLVASIVPRIPYALVVSLAGLIISAVISSLIGHRSGHNQFTAGLWHPSPFVPRGDAWKIGAIEAAIPQLPLTTLNSILAVTSLSATLFPQFPPAPSTTSLGFSVAIANLVGCWFGAMPVCHGSGGLAGQFRFGARSGSSIIILGIVKLLLGLFVGRAIVPLLTVFPRSLLGVMVLAAGVELAKVGQSVGESRDLWEQAEEDNEGGRPAIESQAAKEREVGDRWTVMLITVAGCLASKNDAVGFIAGLTWFWGLKLPALASRLRHRNRSPQLRRDEGEQEDLLDMNYDSPEGRII